MSASISSYGSLAQVMANMTQVHSSLDAITEQASSGLVAQTFAGLGSNAGIALNLSPQIQLLQTWQGSISAATGSMDLTQNALSQISSIASSFYASINNINSINSSQTDSVAAQARQALQQVAGLLNSQSGSEYLFGGNDTANAPVPSGTAILQSNFFTQIQSSVVGLTSSNSASTFQAILAIGGSNDPATSPFSTSLSQPAATVNAQLPVVQTGVDQTQTIGIAASANAFVSSSGTETTGSYMRDILVSLATIGSMTSAQTTNGSDLSGLVADTGSCLSGAITAINQDAGELGNTQAQMTTQQTNLAEMQTTVSGQVSDVQNVDMAKTLTALSQVQTQLQASYQVLAAVSGLSLSKFLPT